MTGGEGAFHKPHKKCHNRRRSLQEARGDRPPGAGRVRVHHRQQLHQGAADPHGAFHPEGAEVPDDGPHRQPVPLPLHRRPVCVPPHAEPRHGEQKSAAAALRPDCLTLIPVPRGAEPAGGRRGPAVRSVRAGGRCLQPGLLHRQQTPLGAFVFVSPVGNRDTVLSPGSCFASAARRLTGLRGLYDGGYLTRRH